MGKSTRTGQAADATTDTQVKTEDAPKNYEKSKVRMSIWIRLPRHEWQNSWSGIEDPAVPLERHLYGHPASRLLVRKTI